MFKITPTDSQSSFTLSTDYLVATFDGSTGLLQSIRRRYAGRVILTYVDFTTYSSPTSGAYLFLPNGAPQVYYVSSSYKVLRQKNFMIFMKLFVVFDEDIR